MTELNRTKFQDGPTKPARKHQSVARSSSDGVLKATSVDASRRQNLFEIQSNTLNPPKRNETSPAFLSSASCLHANGSHFPVNGVQTCNGQKKVKKSPLLPPKKPSHRRAITSDSSDSSGLNKSDSSVSAFRPVELTAQSANQDTNHSSISVNPTPGPRQDQPSHLSDSSEPKHPLLPPSSKLPTPPEGGLSPPDDRTGGKAKPLPPLPVVSRSPSNLSRNAIMEELPAYGREGEEDTREDEPNLSKTGSNVDNRQPNVQELKFENAALRRQVFHLKQQQVNLREQNQVLLCQNTKQAGGYGNNCSTSGSPTQNNTPTCISGPKNTSSPIELVNSAAISPIPPTSSAWETPPQGVSTDPKEIARMQLARVIERAKAGSPDDFEAKKPSQSTTKSLIQSPSPMDAERSPNPSITSPLSPLSPSSTPSPTVLVSFGLASQAKRRKTRQDGQNRGDAENTDTQLDKGALPVPRVSQPVAEFHSPNDLSSEGNHQSNPVTEDTAADASTSGATKPLDSCHENSSLGQVLKPGQFTGKVSIVSTTAKRFQGIPEDDQALEMKKEFVLDANRVENLSNEPHWNKAESGKESASSESENIFSTREQPQALPAVVRPKKHPFHGEIKSESQVGSEKGVKKGVVSKRSALKSDASWITPKSPTKADNIHTDQKSLLTQRTESPTSASSRSPTTRPYRSHQILNTSSPPLQPSQSIPPRTFNATSQLALLGAASSKSETKHQPQGSISAHHLTPFESDVEKAEIRERVSSISGDEGSKSKRWGSSEESTSGITRSVSDENFPASRKRRNKISPPREAAPSVHRSAPKRPLRPPLIRNKDVLNERMSHRPASVLIAGGRHSPPRAWEGDCGDDLTVSCTVPSGSPSSTRNKSPKQRFKKSSDANALSKKGSVFDRLKVKIRDKDQPRIPAPTLEEEEYGDSESSSEDEKGGTIKYKPRLRPVSVRRPSQVEDDFDLSYPQLFERVFVVGLKKDPTSKKLVTEVTYTFPPRPPAETARDETMESIPQFCFPDIDKLKPTTRCKSETFSFVLTNMEGNRRFGYCRRFLPSGNGARLPEVTCLVSPLGCFSLYEKILDHVEERRQVSTTAVFTFLKAIVANPFPKPGRSVKVRAFSARGGEMETVTFTRPLDSRLEHVDLSLLFNTLNPRKIIQLFSSVLMERRIILCSSNLSLMTGCAHALLALLYPFEWQHVFIPVLPGSLIDFCCSPLPYMIGMDPSLIRSLDDMDTMEEALVVDLDKKKFARKIGDEASILPSKLFQYLENTLASPVIAGEYQKPASKRANPCRADEIIINTFMIFFVYLYGDYKQYMLRGSDGAMEFQKKEYERKFSSKSIRRFLEAFHMTQMFENFIEQRENPLKAETTAQSTFEHRSIREMKERCMEIEIFRSKSKISQWRLRKRI